MRGDSPLTGDLPPLDSFRADRVMFGTDFPNIPYAWDREIKKLAGLGLKPDDLETILSRNAADFYGIA